MHISEGMETMEIITPALLAQLVEVRIGKCWLWVQYLFMHFPMLLCCWSVQVLNFKQGTYDSPTPLPWAHSVQVLNFNQCLLLVSAGFEL